MLGLPEISLPVMTKVQAGSWLIALVCTVFTTAMSSTIFAVCGRSELTQRPHSPCWVNVNFVGATGNFPCPLVIVVMRSPRKSFGNSLPNCSPSFGLWSQVSSCDGPPFMCR